MLADSLNDLYAISLKKMLDGERHTGDALPAMIEHTHSGELKSALRERLEETRRHQQRLTHENLNARVVFLAKTLQIGHGLT